MKLVNIGKGCLLLIALLSVWVGIAIVTNAVEIPLSPNNLVAVNLLVGALGNIGIVVLAKKYWFPESVITLAVMVLFVFLLVSVIVAALNNCRDCQPGAGHDRVIKRGLSSIRVPAYLYEDVHGGFASTSIPASICNSSEGYKKSFFSDPASQEVFNEIKEIAREEVICAVSIEPPSFAASARLNKDRYFCVDSTGALREVSHHITEARCPKN